MQKGKYHSMKQIPKKPKPILVNFKVSQAELTAIHKNAKLFAKNNVSRWLRYVGAKEWPTPKKKPASKK